MRLWGCDVDLIRVLGSCGCVSDRRVGWKTSSDDDVRDDDGMRENARENERNERERERERQGR